MEADEISPEAQIVLDGITDGKSLRQIARDGGPKASTFLLWVGQNKTLAEQYARAIEIRSEMMAEEILEIADDATNDFMLAQTGLAFNHEHVQRSKLRVDSRKWILAKLQPKKYGDKIVQEHTGPNGKPLTPMTMSDEELERRIRELSR